MIGAPPPTVAVPAAIAFWDTRQGLLGTRSCLTGAGCRTGTISITRDGGRTFQVVLRTRRPITALETAGPAAAIAQLDGGTLVRTLDGGRSWRPFRLQFETSFATPSIGLGFRTHMVGTHLALELVS